MSSNSLATTEPTYGELIASFNRRQAGNTEPAPTPAANAKSVSTPAPVVPAPLVAEVPAAAPAADASSRVSNLDALSDEEYYEHMDSARNQDSEEQSDEPEAPVISNAPSTTVPYPPELAPLIRDGKIVYDPDSEHWVVRRCDRCGGLFKDACCGTVKRYMIIKP